MPIPVSCPECHYHFLVGDEFAGRPGRCPECAAIIDVPGADLQALPSSHEPREPSPYESRRAADSFEDDFPSRLRRRGRPDDDWNRYEPDGQADFDDRRYGRSSERTFDAQARAAKWEKVAGGLRNLIVAVVLVTVAQVVTSAFDLVEPIQPGQQNALRERDKAMLIGNLVFFVLAMLMWAYGRIGCGRVPYVPARRVALPAGVIAGLTAVLGACAFGAMVVGVFLVVQNPAGPGGALLLMLGVCAFFPALIGFLVAELMGLVSQVKMATGLRDAAFARASRLQIVVALVLTGVVMAGFCVLLVFMMGEMQKAQKKQENEQRQQRAQQAPPEKADPGPAGAKGKGNGNANGPAPVNNGPAGQQPPPEFDWGDHPGAVYAMVVGRLFVVLTYAVVSVICFQLGRRAVRREIDQLVGDPHDREQPRDEYY
ncbi:MAG TPA: hypothetical protein VKD90_06155 [Gemmataceae bacterium]|nr:hypothetical protein [Gemmataceae bacterium]